MGAVAEAVLRLLDGHTGPADGAAAAGRLAAHAVAPEVEALAAFGAAIHSAHRMLPLNDKQQALAYWCRAALAASPAIAGAMENLLEARLEPCPPVLSAAGARNAASAYPLLPQHGWDYAYLDADLLTVLMELLGGEALAGRMASSYRRIGARKVDLLAPPAALWEPLARFFPEVMALGGVDERATLRCPWPRVAFALLAAAQAEIRLELVARLPAVPDGEARRGKVQVWLNGRRVAAPLLDGGWRTARCRLPQGLLRPGLNHLELRWPALPAVSAAPLNAVVSRLELGLEAELHPVFGELYALYATSDR